MKYSLKIFDNHIILIYKKNSYLIDTGSPSSISNLPEINLFNSNYKTIKNFQGLTVDQLSKYLGIKIDALIGGDILKNYMFNINFKDKSFSILNDISQINLDSRNGRSSIDIVNILMNIPVIEILVNKVHLGDYENVKSIKIFLDTGAKTSYINKKYTKNLKVVDNIEDFYPTIGTFRTNLYNIPIIFNHSYNLYLHYYSEIDLNFGVLPEMLETALLLGNIEGIIGNDIFQHYSLTFDYKRKKIYYTNE